MENEPTRLSLLFGHKRKAVNFGFDEDLLSISSNFRHKVKDQPLGFDGKWVHKDFLLLGLRSKAINFGFWWRFALFKIFSYFRHKGKAIAYGLDGKWAP